MKGNNIHTIFEQTLCPNREKMLAYIEGNLSLNEQFHFEKHLNSCSLCHDEFEGLMAMKDYEELPLIISDLNKQIDGYFIKNTFFSRYNLLRIAAAIIILMGSGFFINYYLQYSGQEFADQEMMSHSMEEKESEEIELIERDSFSAPVTEENNTEADGITTHPVEGEKSSFGNLEPIERKQKSDKIDVSAGVIEDEITDLESTENFKTISSDHDKVKNKDVNPVSESSVEKVIKEKIVLAEESVLEDDIVSEEELALDQSLSKERKSEDNINRAKMLSGKKSRTKGYAIGKDLQKGIDAFYDNKYEESINFLKKYLKEEGKSDEAVFYLAQNYSAQQNAKKALSYYNELLQDKSSSYYNEAMWQKALLLIQINKRKSAINVLKKLVKLDTPHKLEAQKKLDSLIIN